MESLISVQTKLRYLRSIAGDMGEQDFDLLQKIEAEEQQLEIEELYSKYRSDSDGDGQFFRDPSESE